MILTIDRVLQLLAEGKTIDKISQLASCDEADVANIIEEARILLQKHEKSAAKRKIIIKKKTGSTSLPERSIEDDKIARELLSGAELSVIPVNASLVMYTGGESAASPGNAGIGIVILDNNNRQIGKISDFIGIRTKLVAEYIAIIRSIKLSSFFQAKDVKIRTDSETIIKHIAGTIKINNKNIMKYYDELTLLLKNNNYVKIEYIPGHQNDKAHFFAIKGSEKVKHPHE